MGVVGWGGADKVWGIAHCLDPSSWLSALQAVSSSRLLCCLMRDDNPVSLCFTSQMFDRDEKSRVSVDTIKKHRWYSKPVGEQFQRSLDELAAGQSLRDAMVQAAAEVGGSFGFCWIRV